MDKVFFSGTHRVRQPQEALDVITPLFPRHQRTARCRGTSVDENHVPFLTQPQHRQLYGADLPRRRRPTPRRIAGDQQAAAEKAEARAPSVTAGNGITVADPSPERPPPGPSPPNRPSSRNAGSCRAPCSQAPTAAARGRRSDSIATAIDTGRSFHPWVTQQDRAPAPAPSGT